MVPALVTLANLLALAAGDAPPRAWLHFDSSTPLLLVAFVLFGFAEQTGWRGYALPRLTRRFGLPASSALLGTLWATWHLPLFFVVGSGQYGQAFAPYLLEVTGWSFLMSWLWRRAQGAVLPCVLAHMSINVTAVTLGTTEHSAPWRLALWAMLIVSLAWSFVREARQATPRCA
ncbi:CPBP family intramembrane glutamic endopeptidase [Deinococcus pimensis]|uniref:CPBP family intramembrane glutamic endopeptidase n=1 Tax=Deinococcus pimensis TaxID=309888 RepID=UPI0004812844|nr:CPBP family intramembrane glutamic endopeptidase [Deinococcus pimensis]